VLHPVLIVPRTRCAHRSCVPRRRREVNVAGGKRRDGAAGGRPLCVMGRAATVPRGTAWCGASRGYLGKAAISTAKWGAPRSYSSAV
jgi:hypothetical protein